MRNLIALAACLSVLLPTLAYAEEAAPKALTEQEKTAIESVIKEYLTKKHPEIIGDAIQVLQKREQAGAEAKSKEAIGVAKDKIFNDPATPTGGNPKGDISVVEFYDYQCGYCKMSEPAVEKLLKEDKNVKFIYKTFPILGPMSVQASKAATASIKQGKFIPFHNALMSKKEHLNEELIWITAKEVGLDVDKLKKDMADDAVAKQVEDSLKLGGDIGARGTPMFIVGDQVFPGALEYEQLKKAVDEERSPLSKKL